MRVALRLLTPRNPAFTATGVTGTLTHPHPRPTLIAIYNETLRVLSQFPAHSVYRQSAENITKHRLSIIESTKPEGFDLYASEFGGKQQDIKHIGHFMRQILGDFQRNTTDAGHKAYIERQLTRWNQIPEVEDAPAHKQLPGQTADQATSTAVDGAEGEADDIFNIVLEPQLSAEQVLEVEDKIKDGLIEDVVESGWNELECAKAMMEARVWEPLEEVPVKGQWEGFERTPKGVGAQD